jgi:hypothetical protein
MMLSNNTFERTVGSTQLSPTKSLSWQLRIKVVARIIGKGACDY